MSPPTWQLLCRLRFSPLTQSFVEKSKRRNLLIVPRILLPSPIPQPLSFFLTQPPISSSPFVFRRSFPVCQGCGFLFPSLSTKSHSILPCLLFFLPPRPILLSERGPPPLLPFSPSNQNNMFKALFRPDGTEVCFFPLTSFFVLSLSLDTFFLNLVLHIFTQSAEVHFFHSSFLLEVLTGGKAVCRDGSPLFPTPSSIQHGCYFRKASKALFTNSPPNVGTRKVFFPFSSQ